MPISMSLPNSPMISGDSSEEDEALEVDDQLFEDLREEIPTLIAIKRFALSLDRVPWFSTLGEAMGPELRACSRRYLDELGFPEAEMTPIASWEEASDAAASLDWDSDAWSREEQLRASMIDQALAQMDESALQVALTHAASLAADGIREGLENIAAIWDLEDQTLETAATGAALQAVHNAALLLAAGQGETHPFALKFQMFESGRWPIGVAGTSFNLF
jgi:hypothetical protein